MNILLLNWRDPKNPRAGGAEYVTLEHAKAWVKQGHKVTWFASGFSAATQEDVVDGVAIVRRGNSISVFIHALFYYFKNQKNIDVIVDQVHGIPFFSVLYADKPVILFIHEVAGHIWRVMYTWSIWWIGQLLERMYLWMYRNTPVWTDAPSTAEELVRLGIPRRHCVAIPCPIANPVLGVRPKKNTVPTFIFVGRLVRMKRVEDILTALKDIVHVLPKSQLWIVGEGDRAYTSWLVARAKSLGIYRHVTWYGRVSEKKKLALLRSSHVLLHASVKEGWGLVVLEAASQWTPSVVYRIPGLVDTVKDGKTGIVVSSNTPSDLAKQAAALISDTSRYEKMQKEAARFADSLRWADATIQSEALIHKAYDASK